MWSPVSVTLSPQAIPPYTANEVKNAHWTLYLYDCKLKRKERLLPWQRQEFMEANEIIDGYIQWLEAVNIDSDN